MDKAEIDGFPGRLNSIRKVLGVVKPIATAGIKSDGPNQFM